jgi:hypothetical protein
MSTSATSTALRRRVTGAVISALLASLVAALGLAGALLQGGCAGRGDTVLVIGVTVSGSLPGVAALNVTLTSPTGTAQNRYAPADGQPIAFPTTFSARLPARINGDLTIDVKAVDAAGQMLAHGRQGPLLLPAGTRQTLLIHLDCGDHACSAGGGDAGADDGPGADSAGADPNCGNGRIDRGETCDTAIPPGAPGACPASDCDDGLPCTVDTTLGAACTLACRHTEIDKPTAGDNCCPAGAGPTTDSDCSDTCGDGVIEPGETCDTAIPPGAPGACPAAAACDDADPCTHDQLIAASTCSAVCAHAPVTAQSGTGSDRCCPAGAWHAVDVDCPSACGNGLLEPGETCELGLPTGAPDACPASCDDGDPCTLDVGGRAAGCQGACAHSPITAFVSGDGCCPTGGNHRIDRDCPASCGNGVLEAGEACDRTAGGAAACPTSCAPAPSACLRRVLVGVATECTARCALTPGPGCDPTPDGCCPAGCAAATDPDCSPTCGDGAVQAANHETCDVAIAPGRAGACPLGCSDGNSCTRDLLVSAGTCQAICVFVPITDFQAGDGCCPPGADAALDPDCAPVCGNGAAEGPGETCDFAAPVVGATAAITACPSTCPAGDACAPVRLTGNAGACNATCTASPISACRAGDGCCPPGCTPATDADCQPVCGNGVLEPGEACDRGITAGAPGACAASCDDGDPCTRDWASGSAWSCSRACSHAPITACASGDACCPAGCSVAADHDCGSTCGDGRIGGGETCDPPTSCPITCPDDGDPCTTEVLTGAAATCNVACRHVPVTRCSGARADLCCPTGCAAGNDVDCPGAGPGPAVP